MIVVGQICYLAAPLPGLAKGQVWCFKEIKREIVESTASKLIRSWIPTLCLCYAFSATTLKAYRYHETFGAGDYYLDVYFDVNPQGYFQHGKADQKIRFNGFFVNGKSEEPISGFFTRQGGVPRYQFASSQGQFEGQLAAQTTKCEPVMNFQISDSDRRPASGAMNAGFCH